MSALRFSIVIPTRERADTLRFALSTCLDQQFDSYEIIVSDNCSSPETRSVVEAAASPKVRYVRTDAPLAMSNNWEFGLSHARGEYVLLLGDDDGLMPYALRELDRLAAGHGAKVIRWAAAFYLWPTVALPDHANYLRVPLVRTICMRESIDVIREVANFGLLYTELPMLYNAAVHRDVLADLRRRVGRVFAHPIPDVYSGFAVAFSAGEFLSTSVPMSVSGQSSASNGIATLFNRGRSEIDREFRTLNQKDGFRPDPTVPDLPVFPHVPVADSFAFAKRALFPDLDVNLDRRKLTRACLEGSRVAVEDWPGARAIIRESLVDDPELLKWFDDELADSPYRPPQPVRLRPEKLECDGSRLHLDAAQFGVEDIAGAVRLCESLLNYRGREIAYTTVELAALPDGQIRELTAICEEREQLIHRLHNQAAELSSQIERLQQICDEREAGVHRLDVVRIDAEARLRELDRRLRNAEKWSIKRPLRILKRLFRSFGARPSSHAS